MPSETRFKWLPAIDRDQCNGCQECIYACEPRCLKIIDGTAVLTHPDLCGSEEHCIAPCPIEAIHMKWVAMEGNRNIGRWS